MAHAAPGQVGEMKKTVDAAEIDEGAEIGDVLDDSFPFLPDFELGKKGLFLLFTFLLEDHTTRDDDVAAPLVELDDLAVEALAEHIVEIGNLPEGDLRSGKECVNAHELDDQPALYPSVDDSADNATAVV